MFFLDKLLRINSAVFLGRENTRMETIVAKSLVYHRAVLQVVFLLHRKNPKHTHLYMYMCEDVFYVTKHTHVFVTSTVNQR